MSDTKALDQVILHMQRAGDNVPPIVAVQAAAELAELKAELATKQVKLDKLTEAFELYRATMNNVF